MIGRTVLLDFKCALCELLCTKEILPATFADRTLIAVFLS